MPVLHFRADGERAGEAAVGCLDVFDAPQRRVVEARVVSDQVLHSMHNMHNRPRLTAQQVQVETSNCSGPDSGILYAAWPFKTPAEVSGCRLFRNGVAK